MQAKLSSYFYLLFVAVIFVLGVDRAFSQDDYLRPKCSRGSRESSQDTQFYNQIINNQLKKIIDLPEGSPTSIVQPIVLETRKLINKYRESCGKKEITPHSFRRKLKIAQSQQNDLQYIFTGTERPEKELKQLRAAITFMMFPPKNNVKVNAIAKSEDSEDDYFQSKNPGYNKYLLPQIAKDLGCCAVGGGLLFVPNVGIQVCGGGILGNASYHILRTSQDHFHQVYSNPGGPYTNDRNDPAFMRWRTNYINNKNAIKEPLYNFEVEY